MTAPLLGLRATLRDAVAVIERTRSLIAVVVGEDRKLAGVLSDGDIRRALLAGLKLDDDAARAMTRAPITGSASLGEGDVYRLLRQRGVAAMPLVDADGRFVRVAQLTDFVGPNEATSGGEGYSCAVIMAGGEGRRLRPLTLDRPKPMIDIAGVPLLERQVRAMVKTGLKQVFISTNYLGHMIENHFGNGTGFGAQISYLRESRRLGTAGALSLLPMVPKNPILVINGDILTTSDFGKLLAFHRETQAAITVSAMVYRVEVPFGVLLVEGHRATGLEEKPAQSFLCNAGMYVLDPDMLSLVPPDVEINMTDVIDKAIAEGFTVSVFPLHEYWTDIGSPRDLERALRMFGDDSEAS